MPTFNYNPGIPDGPNNPSNDQQLMKINTNSINSIIAVDHFTFESSGGKDGWHQQSTYPNLTVVPTTTVGQLALYSKAGAVSSELFMIRDNNAGTEVALTTSKVGAPSAAPNGFSWLPGGILIQWGTVTPVVNQTLTAVGGLVFPNACFVVLVTEKRTASPNGVDQVYINAKAAGSFSYYATTSGAGFASFDWIAIGN